MVYAPGSFAQLTSITSLSLSLSLTSVCVQKCVHRLCISRCGQYPGNKYRNDDKGHPENQYDARTQRHRARLAGLAGAVHGTGTGCAKLWRGARLPIAGDETVEPLIVDTGECKLCAPR